MNKAEIKKTLEQMGADEKQIESCLKLKGIEELSEPVVGNVSVLKKYGLEV